MAREHCCVQWRHYVLYCGVSFKVRLIIVHCLIYIADVFAQTCDRQGVMI